MAVPTYAYGSQVINDGINYFVTEKPVDFPTYKQALFKVARLEGLKKASEVVDERVIPLTILVVGSSRTDLEDRLTTLYQAFSVRQQPLAIYATDARFFTCDCTDVKTKLMAGKPISAVVSATFVAQQPYALASAASSFSTGLLVQAPVSGVCTYPIQTFAGGGTIYARPTLTITQQTAANTTTLTGALTSGNSYTSLTVAALPVAIAVGDTFILTSGTHTQSAVAGATSAVGDTLIRSITAVGGGVFAANFSYPATTTSVQKNLAWTALSVTQQNDNQVMTITSGLPVSSWDTITIYHDPTLAVNGYTVQYNTNGVPLPFIGQFAIQEPTATSWLLSLTASAVTTISAVWTWTARYI